MINKKTVKKKQSVHLIKEQLALQSMVFPAMLFLLIFAYIPMYGIIIAFKDFDIVKGIWGSEWAGLKYFKQFLTDPLILDVLRNTLVLNIIGLIVSFPAPIILAILINELQQGPFKKITQTISYLPHFLSWVIFAGLILEMLRPNGIISDFCVFIGFSDTPVNFMAHKEWFYVIYITSGLIKGIGFGSILYVAALSGIDQEIYEAATIDGCSRIQRIWHIAIPGIMGTVVIFLILQVGAILNTGIETLLLFQNPLNLSTSETLDTYVYKVGISQNRMAYSTAVGLIKSVVAVILIAIANKVCKITTDKSLF